MVVCLQQDIVHTVANVASPAGLNAPLCNRSVPSWLLFLHRRVCYLVIVDFMVRADHIWDTYGHWFPVRPLAETRRRNRRKESSSSGQRVPDQAALAAVTAKVLPRSPRLVSLQLMVHQNKAKDKCLWEMVMSSM